MDLRRLQEDKARILHHTADFFASRWHMCAGASFRLGSV
jgi:hypothetical protein